MKNQTKILQFKVIIEQDEDGWFVASAPAIPGCHTQGKTYEEVIKNIKEAIELCLEVAREVRQKGSHAFFSHTDGRTTATFNSSRHTSFPR